MEAGRVELTQKARRSEGVWVEAFAELASGKPIAVCRKRLNDVFGFVRFREPFGGVAVAFHFRNLVVERFRDDQVDAILDVVEERNCSNDSWCC